MRHLVAALLLLFASLAFPADKYPLDTKLEGPASDYTARLVELAKHPERSAPLFTGAGELPVELHAYRTPGADLYIGIGQAMHVSAPVATVAAVVADIDHYAELFPGYEEVKIEKKDGNLWLTAWEQIVPVFFLKNIRYKVWYLVNEPRPGLTVFRYQLKESDKLKNMDGLILLEEERGGTRYRELDFWNADYGILKTIGGGKIWDSSVEGIGLSDVAVKLKAEHPDWTREKAREEAKRVMKEYPIEKLVEERKPFPVK